MSQQYQPTGTQTGQTGQQFGGQQSMGQQGMGQPMSQGMSQPTGQQTGQQGSFHAQLPPEFRNALEDFGKVTAIAEWCADQCIESGPQMAECARACEDLADLADLNEKLIARDSMFGPQVAKAYIEVAQQALPILQQHQQMNHVNETLSTVERSLDSIHQLLSTIGQQSQMGQSGGMQTTGQQGIGQSTQGMGQSTQGMSQGGMSQQPMGSQGSFQQSPY